MGLSEMYDPENRRVVVYDATEDRERYERLRNYPEYQEYIPPRRASQFEIRFASHPLPPHLTRAIKR